MRALLKRLRRRAMYSKTGKQRKFWKRSLARNRQKYLMQTVSFDGAPTMRGLALLLAHARKRGWRGTLQSSDRREGVAERYGKSSQAALFRAFKAGRGNPANPPGRSSHELRSDGNPIFHAPVGARLPWFQMGLDVSQSIELVSVLEGMGVDARRPYSSPSEAHHVNVLKDPTGALARLGDI